jgi:CheY-like chemotaxis protein
MGMSADQPTTAPKGSLLIVDDEPSIAKYMGLVLTREGYQVLTAFNAEQAWEVFQQSTQQIRAVVTDIAMPGDWNGLELARRVREASPSTPVLLVSGYEPPGSLEACSGLLSKPFTADLLRTAVRRMVA